MSNLATRLSQAMQDQNITQAALAKAVGMAQSSIWKLASGKARSTTKLLPIARVLGVRPEWLAQGTPPKWSDALKIGDNYPAIVPVRLKAEIWEECSQDPEEFVEIPLLDIQFSAGDGCYELIDQEQYSLIFRRYFLQKAGVPVSSARLVRVSGNSMEPRLYDGDIVGINTEDIKIRDGKTYAIRQGELLRVKVLIQQPDGGIIIRSINREEYQDDVLTRQQRQEQLVIIGRVFWSSHSW